MSADAKSVEQLQQENDQLLKQIAELEQSLGIASKPSEADVERSRVQAIFKKYDADASGFIDVKEFETLAYEAGAHVSVLETSKVDATFAAIAKKDEGKLTFDEFFAWLKSLPAAGASTDSKVVGEEFGLRARLQSKVFMKALENLNRTSAAAAPASSESVVAAPAAPAAGGSLEEIIKFSLKVGEYKDAKLGARFFTTGKPECLEKNAKRFALPEASANTAFVGIEFGVNPAATEEQLQELVGSFEGLLSSVPVHRMVPPMVAVSPLQVHVIPSAAHPDQKVLQVFTVIERSPAAMVHQFVAQPGDVLSVNVGLETAFDIQAFLEGTVTSEALQGKFDAGLFLNRGVLNQIVDGLPSMPPFPGFAALFKTLLKLSTISLDLQFAGIDKFVKSLPSLNDSLWESRDKASLKELVKNTDPTQINEFGKHMMRSIEMQLPHALRAVAGPFSGVIRQIVTCLLGPRVVTLQGEGVGLSVEFTGLDLLPIAAKVL